MLAGHGGLGHYFCEKRSARTLLKKENSLWASLDVPPGPEPMVVIDGKMWARLHVFSQKEYPRPLFMAGHFF